MDSNRFDETAAAVVSRFRKLCGTQALAEVDRLDEGGLKALLYAPVGGCNPFVRSLAEMRLLNLADRARAAIVAARISERG
jgi:hypothetical protein